MVDIPYNWVTSLMLARERFPRAIIGGGALRDLVIGVPPKDVDIFVPTDRQPSVEDMRCLQATHVLPNHGLLAEEEDYERTGRKIFGIGRSHRTFGTPVEYIFAPPEVCDPRGFDLNVNQIWFDGKLHYTGEFATGVLTRTVVQTRLDPTPSELLRAKRISEKLNFHLLTEHVELS